MVESKIKNSVLSLPIHFSVNDEISNDDTRFVKCTIDVLHTGTNYNGSVFTKEVVEENIDTIKNTPILGFIREMPDGEYDFKGHEYIITKDENGVRRKNIGSAWGLVPESCNPRWFAKTLDNGEEVEMLQVDALLWSKLEDSIDIMKRDIEKAQSMELDSDTIEGYEDPETGLFHFTRFSFDGCTILGQEMCPAMQDANITIYSKNEVQFTISDFVKNIQSELNDKYSAFTKIMNGTTNQDFTENNMVNEKTNQGGNEKMPKEDFAMTLLEQFSDISAMVSQYEMITDRWGDTYPRYYAVDIQENEVIVVDRKNGYNYYGISFTMNGDKAEIDFESAKRKKLLYDDYEEGTTSPDGAFDFGKHIAEIEDTAFAKVEEVNTKVTEFEVKVSEFETAKNEIEEDYNQIKAEFEEMKPKYEDYVKAEQSRIEAELDAQKDAEFAKYETVLTDDVNFAALKEKKAEMTVKEIESECAILYARKNLAQTNFSKSNDGNMTAGLIDNAGNDGIIETKYGYIPIRR